MFTEVNQQTNYRSQLIDNYRQTCMSIKDPITAYQADASSAVIQAKPGSVLVKFPSNLLYVDGTDQI